MPTLTEPDFRDFSLDTLINKLCEHKIKNSYCNVTEYETAGNIHSSKVVIDFSRDVNGKIYAHNLYAKGYNKFYNKIIANKICLKMCTKITGNIICETIKTEDELELSGNLICHTAKIGVDRLYPRESTITNIVIVTNGIFNNTHFLDKVFAGENVKFNDCEFEKQPIILPENELFAL